MFLNFLAVRKLQIPLKAGLFYKEICFSSTFLAYATAPFDFAQGDIARILIMKFDSGLSFRILFFKPRTLGIQHQILNRIINPKPRVRIGQASLTQVRDLALNFL
jgi:hypothetical protein